MYFQLLIIYCHVMLRCVIPLLLRYEHGVPFLPVDICRQQLQQKISLWEEPRSPVKCKSLSITPLYTVNIAYTLTNPSVRAYLWVTFRLNSQYSIRNVQISVTMVIMWSKICIGGIFSADWENTDKCSSMICLMPCHARAHTCTKSCIYITYKVIELCLVPCVINIHTLYLEYLHVYALCLFTIKLYITN